MHTKSTPVIREVASFMITETLAGRETHRSAGNRRARGEHQQRRIHSLLVSMAFESPSALSPESLVTSRRRAGSRAVAFGGGAGDPDPAERPAGPWLRSCVEVLGEDGVVAMREPAEKIVGDPRGVGAVLAVAAAGRSEGPRPVRRDVIGERLLAPGDVRAAPGPASRRSVRPAVR